MKLQLFSIRDAKTGIFAPPFAQTTPGQAERTFKTIVNDASNPISKYPEDYSLFVVGHYDDNTGIVEPTAQPEQLVTAVALVQHQN